LLKRLQAIELELGRQRNVKFGPRVIDLDILFYGDEIVSEPGIKIPHPRLAERPFVLIPLNEIRPKLIHPVLGKSVSELLASLTADEQVVKKPNLLADLASSLSPPRS
jgi:7,8-dihydro-6-hydroxymethylpterin-pyrophosphokinase